jgi:hypothetical protein
LEIRQQIVFVLKLNPICQVMRRYKAKVAEGARAGEAIARLVKPTSSSLQKAQPVIKQGLQPVKQPVGAVEHRRIIHI